jgi:hypothetical protein
LKHSYDVCKYEAKNFRKKAKTNKRRKNDNWCATRESIKTDFYERI